MKKLHVTAFALACGLTWGIFVFMVALVAMFWGLGSAWVNLIGDLYLGTAATWGGAFIGLIWAFVDGFIGALIFVLLYNYFAKKLK